MAGFGLAGTSVYADDPQAIVPEKHLDLSIRIVAIQTMGFD